MKQRHRGIIACHLVYKGPDLARDGFDPDRGGREDSIEALQAEDRGVHRRKIQEPNRQVQPRSCGGSRNSKRQCRLDSLLLSHCRTLFHKVGDNVDTDCAT